jgi:hypothetical protein
LDHVVITSSIYFYTVNKIKIVLKSGKICFTNPIDYVISLLDRKYGIDTETSLIIGASILRVSFEIYSETVKSRRQYYNK